MNNPRFGYLITGSNGEIGQAICRKLTASGHVVFAVTRRPIDFAELNCPGVINKVVNSITDAGEIGRLFDELEREGARIDGLVYGAAIFNRFETLQQMTAEKWREILDVNVVGSFLWAREFAGWCKKSDRPGSVVNITSQAAFTGGYGGVIPYASSKGALVSCTKGLARELATHDIRVNCVAPGFIESGAMRGNLDEERMKFFYEKVPMGRLGHVEEVASVVEFLLSSSSSYLTGTTIDVTGGQLMQ